MSEWGRGGGQVPRNEAAQREHLEEVQENLQRDREADRVAKAHHGGSSGGVATPHRPTTSQARTPRMAERHASSHHIPPWPRHDWHRRVIEAITRLDPLRR